MCLRGGSLVQLCTFRELLENEKSRKIVGFDMFGPFPKVSEIESDVQFVDKWNDVFQDEFMDKEDIEKALENKEFGNYELIKGNILSTIDEYIEKHPHTRIALLHIDTDVYEPAKYALEKLYDRVVKGGVIIFDDYATIEGETKAVDEFFMNKDYEIKKFPFSHTKPSYVIKR